MRLTSVTLTFIFFGTVFATPIYPLRGNAVELYKRASEGQPMPGLGGDGEDPPQSPARGRGKTRVSGGNRKGKQKAAPAITGEGDGSDAGDSKSPTGSKRRKSQQGSRSASNKRKKSNLVTEAVFVAALRNIKQEGTAGQGSRSLGVYHITQPVEGHGAVVKIIDDRLTESEVRTEVSRLNHVGQLLGWGQRKATPKLFYVLMENKGVRLDKVEGLDPTDPDHRTFIDNKKNAALTQQEEEHQLKHDDPKGDDNYLWEVNPDAASQEDRYKVNVVDWAGATKTGPKGTSYSRAPKLFDVPNDIYAPKGSQKSSKKGTSTPSDGNSGGDKTPPRTGHSGDRKGLRSQSRSKAETSGTTGQE